MQELLNLIEMQLYMNIRVQSRIKEDKDAKIITAVP